MDANAQRIHQSPKDYWRILPDAMHSLFASYRILRIGSYGNLLSAVAALSAIAAEGLTPEDLDACNPEYPVITWIVAEKHRTA